MQKKSFSKVNKTAISKVQKRKIREEIQAIIELAKPNSKYSLNYRLVGNIKDGHLISDKNGKFEIDIDIMGKLKDVDTPEEIRKEISSALNESEDSNPKLTRRDGVIRLTTETFNLNIAIVDLFTEKDTDYILMKNRDKKLIWAVKK